MVEAVPFFFEPTHLDYERKDTTGKVHHDRCTLVDGGMLSNSPVDVFDRTTASRRASPRSE